MDLIAPAGKVDAGDAGIGSAGNLNVAAQQVVGLDNIQVGGTSTRRSCRNQQSWRVAVGRIGSCVQRVRGR